MNLIEHYSKASLTKRILLMMVIPCFSYFMMAGVKSSQEMKTLDLNETMVKTHHALSDVSVLIKDMQLERGNSVLFLTSSNGQVKIEDLQVFRSNTDAHLVKAKQSLEYFEGYNKPAYERLMKSLESIYEVRSSVEKDRSVPKAVRGYTDIISSLLQFGNASSEFASSHVSNRIKGLLLLEVARENAGLLRAGMSGIVNEDLPVDSNAFSRILQQKAAIDSNLKSIALEVDEDVRQDIRTSYATEHWGAMDRIFQAIIVNSNEGGFGESGSDTFAVMTKVVNDIGRYIQSGLDDMVVEIDHEREQAYNEIMILAFGIALNIILIYFAASFSIRNIKIQLSEVIDSISKSVGHVTVVSKDLTRTSHSLSSGSQETAAALQETVSSISEMNSMVSRTLDKSKETKSASEDINNKVSTANTTVTDMVESMDDLSKANESLDEVNGIIRSISKQVKVINDIVFKTQLLAVNASIEAAKAGAHGKGFAVVADEVSKLAQMSGEASERISQLLDDSENKVTRITKDVSTRVTRGGDTAKSVKNAFTHISSDVNKIKHLSDDMAQACEEQSLGIEQVTTAIAEIDNATQSNTSEAQVVETHASKLSSESSELGVISEDMAFKFLGLKSISQIKNVVKIKKDDHNSDKPPMSHIKAAPALVADPSDFEDHPRIASEEDHFEDDLADDDSFRPAS